MQAVLLTLLSPTLLTTTGPVYHILCRVTANCIDKPVVTNVDGGGQREATQPFVSWSSWVMSSITVNNNICRRAPRILAHTLPLNCIGIDGLHCISFRGTMRGAGSAGAAEASVGHLLPLGHIFPHMISVPKVMFGL